MPADAPTAFTCARIAVETAPGEYALRAVSTATRAQVNAGGASGTTGMGVC